jgi:HSP20 family protein
MSNTATAKASSPLEQQLNSLFNNFFINIPKNAEDLGSQGYRPTMDIYETDEAFYIVADLPGFSADAIQVRYENRSLTLSGERKREELPDRRYHRVESTQGRFQRNFTLPLEIDADNITAELVNGVLTLKLPKQESQKPRQITVKIGEIGK